MSHLLDTQLVLWSVAFPDRLPAAGRRLIEDPTAGFWFSAASIWEIAIKFGLHRPDFTANPDTVRAEALAIGFRELSLDGNQAAKVAYLPAFHRDPFDRLLVAQATVTGLTLLTHDRQVAAYPGPIQYV